MLSYQSCAFEDLGYLQRVCGVTSAPEFEARLDNMDLGCYQTELKGSKKKSSWI